VVSFKSCNLQNPKPLLIGSYSDLELTTKDLDKFDAPWEVAIRYKPPQESIGGSNMYSNLKPWKEVLKTPGEKKNLTVRANAPGEYIVIGIKGKVRTSGVCWFKRTYYTTVLSRRRTCP